MSPGTSAASRPAIAGQRGFAAIDAAPTPEGSRYPADPQGRPTGACRARGILPAGYQR